VLTVAIVACVLRDPHRLIHHILLTEVVLIVDEALDSITRGNIRYRMNLGCFPCHRSPHQSKILLTSVESCEHFC
jgi:hypothetical protein